MIAPRLVVRSVARGVAPSRRTSWAVAALLATLTACGRDSGRPVAAGRNQVTLADSIVEYAPPPELPPSLVELPVRYELAPAVAALERVVPRAFGNLGDRRPIPGRDRLSYAFAAERTPFEVRVRGSRVTVSSIVTYRGRGWFKPPVGPSIGGSCGVSGDAPRLRITLTSTVRVAPDWTLRSHTQVPTVEPLTTERRDRCRLTRANVDVTDRVVGAVRKQLEGKAAVLDERVGRLDVRSRVGRWWALLGRPIRLRDGLWLLIRPEGVRLGALRGADGALLAPLALTARPRIVAGDRPDSSTAPLPDITPGTPGEGGLNLLLEAALDYDVATRLLSRQLIGKRFERGGRAVTVRELHVFGARGGRIAMTLGLTGDVDARVVLVGRPVYDSTSGTLRVPDLDYAVADASLLVRGADQMGHDALRDALRERASWPVTALLDSARVRAERAMNRELTRGVRLGARVEAGRPLGVYAASDGLRVRAAAGGRLSLDVDRAVPVRARRATARKPAPATR